MSSGSRRRRFGAVFALEGETATAVTALSDWLCLRAHVLRDLKDTREDAYLVAHARLRAGRRKFFGPRHTPKTDSQGPVTPRYK